MLEIRTSVRGIDTRFTYFQDPVRVKDALGRVFYFPSEFSIEALNAEIKARFKEGRGSKEVKAGNFEVFDARNHYELLRASGSNVLLPGVLINMAIVVNKMFNDGEECPVPCCKSKTFERAVGGGEAWYVFI